MKNVWRRKIQAVNVVCLVLLLLAGSFCGFSAPITLAGGSAAPEQIILTWTGDPAVTQSITWLMSEDIAAQLQYLPEQDYNDDFDGALSMEVQGSLFGNSNYRYQADLSGLNPDTCYVYRAGGEEAWSPPARFTTADDADCFTFLYLGDVQSGYADWGNMLDEIQQSHPQIRFSLLGGDLTDNGDSESEWGQFLDAASGYFSKVSLMPAWGNHDGSMYYNFFALPDNGPAGLKKDFYSFDYGNAHFVVLDSRNNTNEDARQWLEADLQSSSKTWKFAMFHHPAYPAFDDNKTIDDSIRENWVPILEDNGVDMVFVGHQHEYMRTYPIFQGEALSDSSRDGIVYVMGNSGSKVYEGGSGFPYIACEESGSNYQVIDIDGAVLTMRSIKADGQLIESYSIDKSLLSPPALQADSTSNTVGQEIELAFADEPTWRAAIEDIRVNGNSISGRYNVGEGRICIDADVFTAAGDYQIVVQANGYADASVTQPITASIVLNTPANGQEFKQGNQVVIQGTAGEVAEVIISVSAPDDNTIYGPEDIAVENGEFATSFTLSSTASTGTYKIVLNADSLPSPLTSTFKVVSEGTGGGTVPGGDVVLTISGNGVNSKQTFTLQQLQDMDQYQQVYSVINTWPTKKWYVGKGVLLQDLLDQAGMNSSAQLIRFTAKDGYTATLTVKELLNDRRYCFPGFKEGSSDADGHIPGSSAGARDVETMLALISAEGTNDSDYMNDLDSLLLMMGQRAVTEQTGNLFVKKVSKIEVLTTSPSTWDAPVANPGSSEVESGTLIRLSNQYMDDDKIYYTTDGSTPTIESPMYNWVASRWWSSRGSETVDRINHPIEISRDTTIKAITIGPGKRDSAVATFTYQLKQAPASASGAVSSNTATEISLGNEAMIKLPANAIRESGTAEVKIERITTPPTLPEGYKLGSGVYEFSVNGETRYSFAVPVTITLRFDPDLAGATEVAGIYYYDEAAQKWINLGGSILDNTINVEVEHFTKFAVLIAEVGEEEQPLAPASGLKDVQGHWAEAAISQLLISGAINGYPDGSFKPENLISRAEFVTVLVKAFKLEGQSGAVFADTSGHWAKDYVAAAAGYGIVKGYTESSFGPDDCITREQMAVMICRAARISGGADEPLTFTDQAGISQWARDAVKATVEHKIVNGYPDNTFRPQENAKRAEAAAMIVKALDI
jgi:hypothetical protein